MRLWPRNKKKGFSLFEILITLVILVLLAAIVIPLVMSRTHKAREAVAITHLGTIRSAELLLHNLTGKFVAAADHPAILSTLGLLVEEETYTYKIIDATDENFLAVATPLGPLENWLREFKIDKDGFVGYNPYAGSSGSGGGSGSGGSGGGSGGGSVGSSGGNSGGTSGSGGSSSFGSGGGNVVYTPVTTYYTITEAPVTDETFAAPTALQLTPNDNWLVLNFKGNTNADGYEIMRRENVPLGAGEVPEYQSLTGNIAWGSPTWEDQVDNAKSYCYVARSLKRQEDGSYSQSETSAEICGQSAPNLAYEAKSGAALDTLSDNSEMFSTVIEPPPADAVPRPVDVWSDVVASLTGNDIPVLFAKMHDIQVTNLRTETMLGGYNPVTHTITLNDKYANAPKEMIASIIAHEGLHQMWDLDWDSGAKLLGKPPAEWVKPGDFVAPRSENSRKQEYNSFVGGLQVWEALKGQIAEPLDSNAASLQVGLNEQQAIFLDEGGDPVSFTSESVAQFFSGMTNYEALLDY